ncbi:MAG: hypothetical protein PHS33_09360 [Candidatus Omnitrophica bacterium]|nr:hypothetical protein [Candidatus Omnitrophota bacterium]
MNDFIPNWKRNGFESGDQAIEYAIGKIIEQKKTLKKVGLTDEIILNWKGKTIRI